MKNKYVKWGGLALLVLVILAFVFSGKKSDNLDIKAEVAHGDFEVLVTTTGELQAKSSVDISGPQELRNSRTIRLREIKIQNLVAEGTVVDSGDFVAELDRSEASNSLKDLMDELEKAESQHLKTQLDTTMTLRELRDQLVNLKFTLEEKEIVLEQSKFEPPATIRQAEIELDKAQRTYNQTVENYGLKVRQSVADMREAEINLEKARRKVQELKKIIGKFTIYAPQTGMVIYKKEWGGEKRKVGSSINPWDMTVATLPDLSSMTSKTFVNEVDISKVKEGQSVRIGVDAFPERSYTGEVTSVANVGEQLPNTDAKVFEVLVRIEQSDTILRPAMTTSNEIVTQTFEEVNYIPLEAVHANDSLSYVFLPSKSKQIVLLGAANENFVIVEKGLAEGDEVLLSVPEDPDSYKYTGKELIPLIEEQRAKEEAAKASASDDDNSWDTIKARRQKKS